MPVIRATTVWCDNECESHGVDGTNRRDAIKAARDEGWTINEAQDIYICPFCAEVEADEPRQNHRWPGSIG